MARFFAFIICIFLVGLPQLVAAKNSKVLGYRYQAIWSTAVRFIRADRRFPITDQDKESGYILFTFPGSGAVKECAASLELITIADEQGYQKVRLQLSIAHQPSYIELDLLEKIETKLREERGPEPPPRRAEKRKPDKKDPPKKPAPKKKDQV